ncbi:DEAD/DEAH box helicase [Microbacterium azadirachtae]|uniref:RNA polymerase-associated protein RapA n=1 Tax=Microbacterium azadirachtae TaxID=582680 RepID=A0A0F0LGC7_9MICO|nr:DEAD/DEAH box helicase [Microbacterium azadirachtae]KJL31719.1 RNA polymerase-associated protein RapA [Microbacterium azadirachtae]
MTSADADDWRVLLPSTRASGAPLALGVELRRRDRADARHWASRPLRTATARDLAKDPGELFLAVRPLRRNDAGSAWVQSDADWDAVRRPGTRYDAAHSRWFADLLSISRDSLLSGTAGDWLLLDPVASPLLWPHLQSASAAGIVLVATERSTRLQWSEELRIVVDIAADGDGGLLLSASADAVGESFPATATQAVGSGGAYAHRVVGKRIDLVLGPVPLTDGVRALLSAPAGLTVAPVDRKAFFRDGYPTIMRGAAVRAGHGVTLPAAPKPVPLLVIDFRPDDVVAYRLHWDYPGYARFPLDERATESGIRDGAAEGQLRPSVHTAWTEVTGLPFMLAGALRDADAAEFVSHLVPTLEARGIATETTGTPRTYAELTGDPAITVSTVESTDPDWFELGILVRIDGRTIPFEPLFRALALRQGKLKLVDNTWFSLRHPAFDRLKELLDEAAELAEWETGPRIARTHLTLWEDFEDLADETVPAQAWRAAVEGLRADPSADPVPVPAAITAKLRPYQREGFTRLARLWQHRLGGILADDMGLGKTVQLLALIAHARESRSGVADGGTAPWLVVAPTSVLPVWQREAERFAPGLRVVLAGRTRDAHGVDLASHVGDADLVITSYTVLRLDAEEFARRPWSGVVLDEAQNVKNPATKQHQAVAALDAQAVYAATGTPLENGLGELWALLSLTSPGLFASARRFREDFIQPIEQGKVPENAEGAPFRRSRIDLLRRRIRPFLIRRTKELVAPDLPERQEQVLRVELAPAHQHRYDTVLQRERQKILGLLPDLDRQRFIVFRSLTMLRMLSLAPGLIEPDDAGIASRKLEELVERLIELRSEGHRALVFSQFTSFLGLAAERLRRAGLRVSYLDGSTRDRDRVVQEFREGEQDAFLLSLKAGGTGLTLTEADYVFLLDPWWNPAAEAQAADRAHRIGQQNRVFVYRMISEGTIEEKVLALQQRKARLFSAVLDDEDLFAQSLTADDIRELLG